MPLRLACDLDGTLANMEAALQHHAEELFGPGVSLRGVKATLEDDPPDVDAAPARPPETEVSSATRPLTRRQLRQVWDGVLKRDNFWHTLAEIEPGSVARLAALAAKHRWEVIFLTQRPPSAGHTAQRQSQRWLHDHGFEFPSVYVMNGSRGRLADALALDVVIDDRPENCLDVVTESRARALLVWRDVPASVPPAAARLGIEPVFSVSEALDILEQVGRPEKAGGIVGRLRAAIGL
jgi:hypothetical protein